MKNFLIFILLIIVFLFIYIAYINQPDERNALKHKMIYKFSKEQLKNRNLRLYAMGSGSSKVKDKFDTLITYFNTSDELTIDTGRKLLMEVTNEFLEIINNDKELEKFLYPQPLSINGIKIALSVSDLFNGYKYYPKGITLENNVTYVFLDEGIIRYYIHSAIDQRQKVHQESYEEALKILEKEKNL